MTRNSEPMRQWEILRMPDGGEGGAGPPQRIEIEFDVEIAKHILARDWHPTQQLRTDVDGSVRLTVDVCPDRMLRRWILSFGPLARVVSPTTLAERIIEELDATRRKYAPRMDFELPIVLLEELDAQDGLPWSPSTTD
jgi:predicted DNA-binding transcriptional regulator YafY